MDFNCSDNIIWYCLSHWLSIWWKKYLKDSLFSKNSCIYFLDIWLYSYDDLILLFIKVVRNINNKSPDAINTVPHFQTAVCTPSPTVHCKLLIGNTKGTQPRKENIQINNSFPTHLSLVHVVFLYTSSVKSLGHMARSDLCPPHPHSCPTFWNKLHPREALLAYRKAKEEVWRWIKIVRLIKW